MVLIFFGSWLDRGNAWQARMSVSYTRYGLQPSLMQITYWTLYISGAQWDDSYKWAISR